MIEFLESSVYFGLFLSLAAYGLGILCKKRFKIALCNPLLLAIVTVILFLSLTGIQYDRYYEGAKYISYLLTPATVCLAIPLYEKFEQLKRNWKAILAGILTGTITALFGILALSILFRLSHTDYVTLLPKSITTAIGMDLSKELGGYAPVTAAAIIVTGVFGNVTLETVLKLFRITEPVAKGVAAGTAAHAIGTSKAMELGQTEGAISSLSIVVTGILTVIFAPIFVQFL